MIWCRGEILPDEALAIPATDRAFEHGLGLFETFRTFGGVAPLLRDHLARLRRSAEALRIPVDPETLPDDRAVARLLDAEGLGDDRALRLTATGGSPALGSVVWLRSRPIPEAKDSVRVELGDWSIDPGDPLARHKTLNYWSRRVAMESAHRLGHDETLGSSSGGGFIEGSCTNLFLVGGDEVRTASTSAPILPGILRGLVLAMAPGMGLAVREVPGFDPDQIGAADEVFLTNSVRGIVPVARAEGRGLAFHWPAPGPSTRMLQDALSRRIGPRILP